MASSARVPLSRSAASSSTITISAWRMAAASSSAKRPNAANAERIDGVGRDSMCATTAARSLSEAAPHISIAGGRAASSAVSCARHECDAS